MESNEKVELAGYEQRTRKLEAKTTHTTKDCNQNLSLSKDAASAPYSPFVLALLGWWTRSKLFSAWIIKQNKLSNQITLPSLSSRECRVLLLLLLCVLVVVVVRAVRASKKGKAG